MTHYIVAGRVDCPDFARCRLMGEVLENSLPSISVTVIERAKLHWKETLQELKKTRIRLQSHTAVSYEHTHIVFLSTGVFIGSHVDFDLHIQRIYGFRPPPYTKMEVEDFAASIFDSFQAEKIRYESAKPKYLDVEFPMDPTEPKAEVVLLRPGFKKLFPRKVRLNCWQDDVTKLIFAGDAPEMPRCKCASMTSRKKWKTYMWYNEADQTNGWHEENSVATEALNSAEMFARHRLDYRVLGAVVFYAVSNEDNMLVHYTEEMFELDFGRKWKHVPTPAPEAKSTYCDVCKKDHGSEGSAHDTTTESANIANAGDAGVTGSKPGPAHRSSSRSNSSGGGGGDGGDGDGGGGGDGDGGDGGDGGGDGGAPDRDAPEADGSNATDLSNEPSRVQTPDSRLHTPSSRLDTPNSRLDTASSRLDSANTRLDSADVGTGEGDRIAPQPEFFKNGSADWQYDAQTQRVARRERGLQGSKLSVLRDEGVRVWQDPYDCAIDAATRIQALYRGHKVRKDRPASRESQSSDGDLFAPPPNAGGFDYDGTEGDGEIDAGAASSDPASAQKPPSRPGSAVSRPGSAHPSSRPGSAKPGSRAGSAAGGEGSVGAGSRPTSAKSRPGSAGSGSPKSSLAESRPGSAASKRGSAAGSRPQSAKDAGETAE